MKILPAILTSEHPRGLKVAVDQMSEMPDLTIFVDTWDEDYRQWVVDNFSKKFKVVVNDLNKLGFPGAGKNFVLGYFLESDYTHLIPIDGDDFLWQGSYDKMVKIIEDYPADFYFYEYTDQFWSDQFTHTCLTWTKEWYKIVYNYFVKNGDTYRIRETHRRLRYNYDADRIAIETKKSAEFKYVDDVYMLEDVHRCLRLKREGLLGNLKGYSIRGRDLYCYVKHLEHVRIKNRPRTVNKHKFDHIDDETGFKSYDLLQTLEWSDQDELMMAKRLPLIVLQDSVSYNEKRSFFQKNYKETELTMEFYTDNLIGNPFKDYDVESGDLTYYDEESS